MIKAIFFDADGVTIKKREVFFSERFAARQGITHADVLPFFKNEMHDALVGRVDLKDALRKYLPLWKWEGSIDDFLQYWFSEESPKDDEVLAYIQELREKGIKCYLATGREQYWADHLVNTVGLKDYFDGFLFSYQLGYEKDDKRFFLNALNELNLHPDEVFYFDDTAEDVSVAIEAGITSCEYKNLSDMKTVISSVIV